MILNRLSLPVLVLGATLALACGERPDPGRATAEAPWPELGIEQRWVRVYDPERASNGFTLALARKTTPILIDMSGRVVHAWPEVRARSRVRLLEDCSLLTIASAGERVQEYDWHGELRWEFVSEGNLPHHDLIRLENGNTLVVVLPEGQKTDLLLEVDREGRVVWRWDAGEALADRLEGKVAKNRESLTHINSVQELPPNEWFDRGDTRFRPGNLLISARNLDSLFIVERATGDIGWSLEEGLDQQHEALMSPPGSLRPGYVMLFNNNTYSGRESAVQEIDPRDAAIAWEYRAEGFFTATKGSQHELPNGNVLIASSRGWRVFEVTREGEIVWQWTPPFEPQRPQRYGADHCSELASLGSSTGVPVRPPETYRYIDRELWEFLPESHWVEVELDGGQRKVLPTPNKCQSVLLPTEARFDVEYGLSGLAATIEAPVRFTVSLEAREHEEPIELFGDVLPPGAPEWRSRSIPLAEWAGQWVRLCLVTEGPKTARGADRAGFWTGARIATQDGAQATAEVELTAEELEERRRHLRTMGYVD